MTDERICKRCLLLESGREDILETIKERIERIEPENRVDRAGYQERLKTCSECSFLEDGTCLKCGCYPEFRAAFIKKRCPYNKW